MIIKKKYTTIKQTNDKEESEKVEVTDTVGVAQEIESALKENVVSENESSEKTSTPAEAQSTPIEKEPPKKKSIDDLDLSLDNIKFEPREERREGTRRRGYRRTQDRNIISRAQKDAISIKETAKQTGYKEGIEEAKKDLDELRSNFAEFFNYKEEVFTKVSECIMDIAVEMAKKIIKKEIETDKEYIIPMIKSVLEEVNKTENKITLKVMPKDVEIVKDKISDIFSGNYFEAKISVVPDNDIKDGGVIVETSNGLIDAEIETQLIIIENALKKQEEGKE